MEKSAKYESGFSIIFRHNSNSNRFAWNRSQCEQYGCRFGPARRCEVRSVQGGGRAGDVRGEAWKAKGARRVLLLTRKTRDPCSCCLTSARVAAVYVPSPTLSVLWPAAHKYHRARLPRPVLHSSLTRQPLATASLPPR